MIGRGWFVLLLLYCRLLLAGQGIWTPPEILDAAYENKEIFWDLKQNERELPFFKKKNLLVFYFSISCSHCKEALPHIFRVYNKYKIKNLSIIAVAIKENQFNEVIQFAKDYSDSLPILYDRDKTFGTMINAQITPTIVLINKQGKIKCTISGYFKDAELLYDLKLDQCFGSGTGNFLWQDRFYDARLCSGCHVREYLDWITTRHAYSLIPLNSDQQKDPECMICHVTGWGESGGFIDFAKSRALAKVQCEACHGKTGGHLKSVHQKVPQEVCSGCHREFHPHEKFQISDDWPKINHVHPLTDEDIKSRSEKIQQWLAAFQ